MSDEDQMKVTRGARSCRKKLRVRIQTRLNVFVNVLMLSKEVTNSMLTNAAFI